MKATSAPSSRKQHELNMSEGLTKYPFDEAVQALKAYDAAKMAYNKIEQASWDAFASSGRPDWEDHIPPAYSRVREALEVADQEEPDEPVPSRQEMYPVPAYKAATLWYEAVVAQLTRLLRSAQASAISDSAASQTRPPGY
jgi:DNA-binding transcriptional regulator GbsR (MarR family)